MKMEKHRDEKKCNFNSIIAKEETLNESRNDYKDFNYFFIGYMVQEILCKSIFSITVFDSIQQQQSKKLNL